MCRKRDNVLKITLNNSNFKEITGLGEGGKKATQKYEKLILKNNDKK